MPSGARVSTSRALENLHRPRLEYNWFHVTIWLPSTFFLQGHLTTGTVVYTALLNQTAIHGVPAALNAANNALLRAWTGNPNATIRCA